MSDPSAETASKKRPTNDDDSKKEDNSSHRAGSSSSSVLSGPPTMVVVPVEQIDSAKEFIKAIFVESRRAEDRKRHWQRLSDHWKSDPDVAFAALCSFRYSFDCPLSLNDLPLKLRNDREFLLEAVKRTPELWLSLPSAFENDPAFARVIDKIDPRTLATKIFRRFPDLRHDPAFWLKCISGPSLVYDYSFELINDHAPAGIRRDASVMLEACCAHESCFQLAHPVLFESRSFVEGIVRRNTVERPLKYIPHEIQMRWPDLVVESFGNIRAESTGIESWVLCAGHVAPALWNDPTVKNGWFRAGCPYLEQHFPQEWKEDSALFLLLAEHCGANQSILPTRMCRQSFAQASLTLRGSKDFMLRAVELNPDSLAHASFGLQIDFDVVMTAGAHWDRNLPDEFVSLEQNFVLRNRGNIQYGLFIESVTNRIREELDAHSLFTTIILPGMKFGGDTSSLTLLNQGAETAEGYTKRIADFLGVPCGKRLRLLRQAAGNLPSSERIQLLLREFDESLRDEQRHLRRQWVFFR